MPVCSRIANSTGASPPAKIGPIVESAPHQEAAVSKDREGQLPCQKREEACRGLMSDKSEDTRPALARSSSVSRLMICAIAFTLSSAGGGTSSRSTLER